MASSLLQRGDLAAAAAKVAYVEQQAIELRRARMQWWAAHAPLLQRVLDPEAYPLAARVGAANMTFETDYPHADSTWPNTKALAEDMFRNLDAATIHKVVRGNAIELLGLDLA